MRRKTKRAFIAAAIALLAGGAWSSVVVLIDQRGLVQRSHRIFWGTCRERECLVDDRGMIVTRYVFTVYEGLKGRCAATEEVTLPGGVVGNRGLVMAGMPSFAVGDELVLFLAESTGSYTVPVGLAQGRFEVFTKAEAGAKHVRGLTGPGHFKAWESGMPAESLPARDEPRLEDFLAGIRRLVAEETEASEER